jgi:predicted short-subunit dehydrogenase-like oxidoreductase (DUF2520 family)
MGIGPDFTASRYGIVGDGRLARHIACYFSLLHIHHRQWSRRTGQDPARLLAGCPVVLILISDGAIEAFIKEHFQRTGQTIVHCSGALSTPLARGFHPLMSFGPKKMGLEDYAAIPFISEEGRPLFPEVFPELKNPHYEIPKGTAPLYHSLAVMAGNFSVILWQKLLRDFQGKLGLPKEAALPYLRRALRNIEADPEAALTGPLQRGDHATIVKNLKALKGDPFAEVYESFVRACGIGSSADGIGNPVGTVRTNSRTAGALKETKK